MNLQESLTFWKKLHGKIFQHALFRNNTFIKIHYSLKYAIIKPDTRRWHVNSSIYYILDNPFHYGEMKTKRGIIKHVYPPLISQELWEQWQKQKTLNNHNGAGLKYSQKPFVLRGLITCGRTGRVCPCEDQLLFGFPGSKMIIETTSF